MSESGIDVLITGSSAQIDSRGALRYLAGYYLPVFEEYLVIPASGPVTFFAHDACGADYAQKYGVADDVRIIPNHEYNCSPGRCVAEFVMSQRGANLGMAGWAGISANFYRSLKSGLGGHEINDFTDEMNIMRMVKSPTEIVQTEEAVRLNESVFYHYLSLVRPGVREMDAINEASGFALENGAEDLYWMASSDEIPYLAYLAEARLKRHIFKAGDYSYIILEHSAEGGHFGETTHLVSLGDPKPEYVRAFAAVGMAQRAAAERIRPGALTGEMADASHEALADAGYEDRSKSLRPSAAIGHGQGLDAWEFPRIASGDETVIQPGMRFNIHPAVVLPDGAKITSCDCYISTETAARRLSSLPYEIIAV
jgi:Xaa-Pro aminopeptidase